MRKWSGDPADIVSDFLSGMKYSQLRRKHHCTDQRINEALAGVGLNSRSKKLMDREARKGIVTESELAWLAGLLEGEAHFGIDDRRRIVYPMIGLSMNDEDIVWRAAEIMVRLSGSTAVVTEKKTYGNSGRQWRFAMAGETASDVMRAILPLMGDRRTARINYILERRAECETSIKM